MLYLIFLPLDMGVSGFVEVGARMYINTIDHQLSHQVYICWIHFFWICQDLGYIFRHSDLQNWT